MNPEVKELIIEGKDKSVFTTDSPDVVIVRYKDRISAFHNIKRASIKDKAEVNCKITTLLYEYLAGNGVPTHFIEKVSDTEQACRKVAIIPIQFVVRNWIAGSTAKLLHVESGMKPSNVIYELRYNSAEAAFPMINQHHAVALGLVTYDELQKIFSLIGKANEHLLKLFGDAGIKLVDYKLECGRTSDGEIIIADEFSPDTCRLWDAETGDSMDKDRFRRDLGGVIDAYRQVLERLTKLMEGK